MTGSTDLRELLSGLDPQLREGVHVFATVPRGTRLDVEPVAVFEEDEGRTLVLREDDAAAAGITGEYRCAWITLKVHSSLAAVGLLARVTGALAAQGISVNPISGFHHDHLFVPHERAADAMRVLDGLRNGGAHRRAVVGEYELDDDPARVDRDVVWRFLSTEAYWARWRTRADVETQIDRAWRIVAAYRRDTGEMVAFARAVADGVSFAYLADVFVVPEARGTGVGVAVTAAMVDDEVGKRMRWVLFTGDAHTLYAKFGFAAPDDTCMVRDIPTAG
ncbi:ACT domain-containing protein [Pseudonocardia sp. TRM90224]|uniref:ACT domain-containing protein n=1 Tax=Pseudonocardia sp. TRM90224 TaxID=2812678 RepID=UPI0027E0353F|nr:ACT domain-containing protein [Pseudonocardia sp. TRM90224]